MPSKLFRVVAALTAQEIEQLFRTRSPAILTAVAERVVKEWFHEDRDAAVACLNALAARRLQRGKLITRHHRTERNWRFRGRPGL